MNRKLLASALMAAGLFSAGVAQADIVNIGGVVFDTSSIFDFSSHDSMIESITNTIGESIDGYAKINTVNGETNQSVFCPGCELTYVFSGFTLVSTGPKFTWSGGTIDVYVDSTPNYNSLLASTASDGILWASLTGHNFLDLSTGLTGTLISDATPTGTGVTGHGTGELDINAGLAAALLDTNTIADGLGGFADFLFTSSFQRLPGNSCFVSDDGITYCMQGSNDLSGDAQVPEPGSLALAGLGLFGLAAARRRKQQA